MAVHDQDVSSGKNGVKNTLNIGRSAGKKMFSKGSSGGKMMLSKGASSALLANPMAGMVVFFGVIILLMVFMLMTMPMSALNSTKNSYEKAAKYIDDQLYDGYDEAARKVSKQVLDSSVKPFDEGGYNCGDVTVSFGYFDFATGADFLNMGVTHDPDAP